MTRQYIFTERTHLMCPNMYFGIVETVNKTFDTNELETAFQKISDAHPFLTALLGYEKENNQYYYDVTGSSKIDFFMKDTEIASIDDQAVFDEYEKLIARDWDLFHEGMLKAVCWKIHDKTCILFVFHHLLADGRAALGLASEFAQLYVDGKEREPVPERLISSDIDLPSGCKLPLVSRMLVNQCNKKWIKENTLVTYDEYHKFADTFLKNDHISHTVHKYDKDAMKKLVSDCKENGVSVNDYLLAKMFIEEHTRKIVIAQDIRKKLSCYRDGALGNYSTAFGIVHKVKCNDILLEAKRVHKIVQKTANNVQAATIVLACYAKMNPGLLDAAAISALGGFRSKAGAFVGGGMFGFGLGGGHSITNLGKLENNAIDSAMFIPPASTAIKKILGVLTVNGQMVICSSERR